MDASPLFDTEYLPLIVATLVGFALLSAVLLVPVYRFLEREKKVAKKWTPEALSERMQKRQRTATNGAENEEKDSTSSTGTTNGSGAAS